MLENSAHLLFFILVLLARGQWVVRARVPGSCARMADESLGSSGGAVVVVCANACELEPVARTGGNDSVGEDESDGAGVEE